MNSVDTKSAAYNWADRTVISVVNPVKSVVTGTFKSATTVDDLGRCDFEYSSGGCSWLLRTMALIDGL
jgi:hypothetical protein